MPSKSEKIAENCTFFFVDSIKCYVRIAKWGGCWMRSVQSRENKQQVVQNRRCEKEGVRKKVRERCEREKRWEDDRVMRMMKRGSETGEKWLHLSRTRAYAHSNSDVVFLLSQVSHSGAIMGERMKRQLCCKALLGGLLPWLLEL